MSAEWVLLSQAFQRLAAGRDGDGAYRDFFATEQVLAALRPFNFPLSTLSTALPDESK